MSIGDIIVTAAGIALSAFIAWYFWFAPKGRSRAAVNESGTQEVAITVKGGYSPDVIVVQSGRPVKLTFRRNESAVCSEEVLFPDFSKSATLPEGEDISVEFTPEKPGEYGFQCKMGMLRGKLIVE